MFNDIKTIIAVNPKIMAQFRGIAPVCVATRRRVCLTRLSTGGTLRVEGQTGRRGGTH